MVITGELIEEADGITAIVEQLGATGNGATRADACESLAEEIADYASWYGLAGLAVQVTHDGKSTLHVASNDLTRMLALLVKRMRIWKDMSLADVTQAIGAKSRNGWAQYEQARCEPSISKLQAMLDIVAPELVVAVIPRGAQVLPRWREEHVAAWDDEVEMTAFIADPSPQNVAKLRAKHARKATRRKASR